MSLLSKLFTKSKLTLGAVSLMGASLINSGCAVWKPTSSITRDLGTSKIKEDIGKEEFHKINSYITQEIIQTEKGESQLDARVSGEQILEQNQLSRIVTIKKEQEETNYKKEWRSGWDVLLVAISFPFNLIAYMAQGVGQTKTEYGQIIEKREQESQIFRTRIPDVKEKTLNLDGVELKISSEKDLFFDGKNPLTVKTDENGKASASISSKTFAMTLEELVQKNQIFSEFQPATIEIRENVLKNGIVDIPLTYKIKLNAGTYKEIPFSGAEATGIFKCKGVSREYLSKEISDFVNQKVNPSMRKVVFVARDIDSHVALRRTTYTLKTTAPSADGLLKSYFSGSALSIAKTHLTYYETGERTTQSEEGELSLTFAPGSDVSIEVTNPSYNFYKGDFKVTDTTSKKIIEMSEKGQKVRVKMVDE